MITLSLEEAEILTLNDIFSSITLCKMQASLATLSNHGILLMVGLYLGVVAHHSLHTVLKRMASLGFMHINTDSIISMEMFLMALALASASHFLFSSFLCCFSVDLLPIHTTT